MSFLNPASSGTTPSTRGESPTCHASDNSRRFDDVSSLHFLRGDDPPFAVPARDQSDVSGPAGRSGDSAEFFCSAACSEREAAVSPARVVSHLDDLLLERSVLIAGFVSQPLEVHPPVPSFVAPADTVGPDPPYDTENIDQII